MPPDALSGFFDQVRDNTNYIIHPEEVLADNFSLLVREVDNVSAPEILERLRAILLEYKAGQAVDSITAATSDGGA